mgnify:CR=1 FL=1
MKHFKEYIKESREVYFYVHKNGKIIFKPITVVNMAGGPKKYFDSPFVKGWWLVDVDVPEQITAFIDSAIKKGATEDSINYIKKEFIS